MKKILLALAIAMFTPNMGKSQQTFSAEESDTASLSQEEIEEKILAYYRKDQVLSIANVDFGTSYKEAERKLKRKFGEPSFLSSKNKLLFDNVKYGGFDFKSVFFLFQSDENNSFLNCCIFIREAKDYAQALEIEQEYADILSSKYTKVFSEVDEKGNPFHFCGFSPLWDGTLQGSFEAGVAIHTDIMKYDEDLVKEIKHSPYAVRLIYGPFNYVKEEF